MAKSTMPTFRVPSFSIILEWETVQEGGLDRALRGLHEVNRQISELQQEPHSAMEVIVCHEEQDISSDELRAVVECAAGPQGWSCPIVISGVPLGTNYYNKKNCGARLSEKDILVFFDTDLLPDPGWLRGLLTPFESWQVSVIRGGTYLDHATTYDMAVALFWIFETAEDFSPLKTTLNLLSNNMAIRRPVFSRFPFPDRDVYRGQCSELGLQLHNSGILLYEQTGARASHPPPPKSKFIRRAWLAGKNEQYYHELGGDASIRVNWSQMRFDYRRMAGRICKRSLVLNPSPMARIAAWGLGWIYYTIKAVGYSFSVVQMRFSKQQTPAHS